MEEDTKLNTKDKFIGVLILVAIFLVPIVFFSMTRSVRAGEIKVVTRFGGTTGRILEPGFNVITPFVEKTKTLSTKKVIYEVTTEDKQKGSDADYKDYPVDTNTKDGQQVDIFYTVRFSVDPTKAVWVVNNIGGMDNLVEKIVKTESRIWARNIPREFEAETLYTGDGVIEVQQGIENRLRPTFEANGLVLDSVGIREIKFTEQYITAIENKQIEAVKVDTAKRIAERAVHEKEATITQAEAQAEAQKLQKETLSAQVLEKTQLDVEQTRADALKISAEKGQKIVPDTVLSGDSDYIYDLNTSN